MCFATTAPWFDGISTEALMVAGLLVVLEVIVLHTLSILHHLEKWCRKRRRRKAKDCLCTVDVRRTRPRMRANPPFALYGKTHHHRRNLKASRIRPQMAGASASAVDDELRALPRYRHHQSPHATAVRECPVHEGNVEDLRHADERARR